MQLLKNQIGGGSPAEGSAVGVVVRDELVNATDQLLDAGKRAATYGQPPVASARAASELSQARFARLMGVSVRTLQEWEQGRRQPSGAAQTLLAVAQRRPPHHHPAPRPGAALQPLRHLGHTRQNGLEPILRGRGKPRCPITARAGA